MSQRHLVLSCLLVACLLGAVAAPGCGGGGLSQADLRARAIRRKSDDQTSQTASAAPPAAAPSPAVGDPDVSPQEFAGADLDQRRRALGQDEQPEAPPQEPGGLERPQPPAELTDMKSEEIRKARAEWCLREIGKAFQRVLEKRPSFPPGFAYARATGGNQRLLSWRVLILPELGYQELYDKFKLDEPWNSPHNRQLLAEMPEVYDMGIGDYRTPFLAVQYGNSSILSGPLPVFVTAVEDGLDTTLLAADCRDEFAVEWTRPEELDIAEYDPIKALSARRFVLFANASVGELRDDVTSDMFRMMTTRDSGEPISAWDMVAFSEFSGVERPKEDPAEAMAADGPADNSVAAAPPAQGVVRQFFTDDDEDFAMTPDSDRVASGAVPLPSDIELAKARQRSKELFEREYLKSTTNEEKIKLAEFMLQQSAKMDVESADRFVVLDQAAAIASLAGDLTLALDAVAEQQNTFQTDLFEPHLKTLQSFAKSPAENRDKARDHALQLLPQAIEADRYDAAEELVKLAHSFAGRAPEVETRLKLNQWKKRVDALSRTYHRVKSALHKLKDDPEDPLANQTVGLWLCLVRKNWPEGGPLLAKSAAPILREIGEMESAPPEEALKRWELAEKWWEFAEREKTHQDAAFDRAAYWYEAATPGLDSLERLKAEMRLREYQPMKQRREDALPDPGDS